MTHPTQVPGTGFAVTSSGPVTAVPPPIPTDVLRAIERRFNARPGDSFNREENVMARRLLHVEAELARMTAAMRALRVRLDLPGHAECDHPKECPWSETHEMIAAIDAALAEPSTPAPSADREAEIAAWREKATTIDASVSETVPGEKFEVRAEQIAEAVRLMRSAPDAREQLTRLQEECREQSGQPDLHPAAGAAYEHVARLIDRLLAEAKP